MSIEKIINEAWEIKDQVNQNSDKTIKDAIEYTKGKRLKLVIF